MSKSTWWYEAKYEELEVRKNQWKGFTFLFILTNVLTLSILLMAVLYG